VQQRRGKSEIANAPKLHHEEFGRCGHEERIQGLAPRPASQ
jgi:hypothetical protein